ncbi:MAG: hypothetical protein ACRDP6_44465 [Actinoallomurus sp.]
MKIHRRSTRTGHHAEVASNRPGTEVGGSSKRQTFLRKLAERRRIFAGGLFAALSSVSDLALSTAGDTTGVDVLLVSLILAAVVLMYCARQETRRKEIECHRRNVLADALAACVGDVHHAARDLSSEASLAEAKRVRDSARTLISDSGAMILSRLDGRDDDGRT